MGLLDHVIGNVRGLQNGVAGAASNLMAAATALLASKSGNNGLVGRFKRATGQDPGSTSRLGGSAGLRIVGGLDERRLLLSRNGQAEMAWSWVGAGGHRSILPTYLPAIVDRLTPYGLPNQSDL
jgi:uncharacterized protein YidB (DUF937 family)